MNKLYVLDAQNYQITFGTPEEPIERPNLFVIGQRPDCSQFLVLSFEAYPGLTATTDIPEGFDFTYCQAWGLTINEEVIQRVWADIRAKAYGGIAEQLDTLYHEGIDGWKAKVKSVKDKYPKL
jgi:hypothetical protein